jgi:hypothetical protein
VGDGWYPGEPELGISDAGQDDDVEAVDVPCAVGHCSGEAATTSKPNQSQLFSELVADQ